MSDLARTMPGYVEHKVFVAEDGERVTLVTFEDRAGHDGWRTHAEHRAAQRTGRADYYRQYQFLAMDPAREPRRRPLRLPEGDHLRPPLLNTTTLPKCDLRRAIAAT
jgi:hypothetical protein